MNSQQADLIAACERFAQAWEAASKPSYGHRKRINIRRDYICLDKDNGPDSWSGVLMVRKSDGQVFGIKGYGQVNLRKPYGHISKLNPSI